MEEMLQATRACLLPSYPCWRIMSFRHFNGKWEVLHGGYQVYYELSKILNAQNRKSSFQKCINQAFVNYTLQWVMVVWLPISPNENSQHHLTENIHAGPLFGVLQRKYPLVIDHLIPWLTANHSISLHCLHQNGFCEDVGRVSPDMLSYQQYPSGIVVKFDVMFSQHRHNGHYNYCTHSLPHNCTDLRRCLLRHVDNNQAEVRQIKTEMRQAQG